MTERYLVDSCILIYLADKTIPEKHTQALNWLEKSSKDRLAVSAQNIREFANICLLKEIIPCKEIIDFIDSFSAKFEVLQDDFIDTKNAVSAIKNKKKLFWDASIVSVMKRNKIETILTENSSDFNALGAKTINPLK